MPYCYPGLSGPARETPTTPGLVHVDDELVSSFSSSALGRGSNAVNIAIHDRLTVL